MKTAFNRRWTHELAPHLRTARLICLPARLVTPRGRRWTRRRFRSILEAVVYENERRSRCIGTERPLFVLYDQIYGSIRVKDNKHRYAAALGSEVRTIRDVDGRWYPRHLQVLGSRVGWLLAAPAITRKMGELTIARRDVGATCRTGWNGRALGRRRCYSGLPERDGRKGPRASRGRVRRLHGYAHGRATGGLYLPRWSYLSVATGLKLHGKRIAGRTIDSNRNDPIAATRESGRGRGSVSRAFGLQDETGWFRLSIGAVSMQDIAELFPRVRALLSEIE